MIVFCFIYANNSYSQNYIKIEKKKNSETKFYIYPVYFADKDTQAFNSSLPTDYLSAKAIERRKKHNIRVSAQDYPVKMQYIKYLSDTMNVEVLKWSKWLNCAIIRTPDTSKFNQIQELSFVIPKPEPQRKSITKFQSKVPASNLKYKEPRQVNVYNYNYSENQIKMINIHRLHNLGFDGKGVTIAVFDGGFLRVNKTLAFDSLFSSKRLLGWYDFVDMDSEIFDKGDHGREVLSTMAANCSAMVGTAPQASYYLFVTEDGDSETQLEEYNYVIAAEMADSLGVDIIHASLGYQDFDIKSLSYEYKQINGNIAISTIGADIAATKGIIIVTSAGNEGDEDWGKITAPADGDSVICVGAVDPSGYLAEFSSRGPTYDGRIAPLVCAQGVRVATQGRNAISLPNGTSFSGPIIAGSIACLLQAFPNLTYSQLYEALAATSSQAGNPDNEMGYGIANFYKAYLYLKQKNNK